MLLCDGCDKGFHIHCLDPPLLTLPPLFEPWFCDACRASGLALSPLDDPTATDALDGQMDPQAPTAARTDQDPRQELSDAQREHLYNGLNGAHILRQHVHPSGLRTPERWVLRYLGAHRAPRMFLATSPKGGEERMTFGEVEYSLIPATETLPPPPARDSTSRPGPLSGPEDHEYEIDAVVDQRDTSGGRRKLKVLFTGYPEAEAEWLFEDRVDPAYVAQFDQARRHSRDRARAILQPLVSAARDVADPSGSRSESFTHPTQPPSLLAQEHSDAQTPLGGLRRGSRVRHTTAQLRHGPAPDPTSLATRIQLPDSFALTTTEGVLTALQTLMPGNASRPHGYATHLAGYQSSPPAGLTSTDPIRGLNPTGAEVRDLLDLVDFSLVPCVVDMFAGTSPVSRTLGHAGFQVITNDLHPSLETDFHLDAQQPSSYRQIRSLYGLDAVATSPPFALLDLVLPLAVHFAGQLVCCHVPSRYVSGAPPARASWLEQLREDGRLLLTAGPPRGPAGRRCTWLIIFRSRALRSALLHPGWEHTLGFYFSL